MNAKKTAPTSHREGSKAAILEINYQPHQNVFPQKRARDSFTRSCPIWVGRTFTSNWFKIQCNEFTKALEVCSYFAHIGVISVKTKLLCPSEVFIQAVYSKIFLHRCLLIIWLSSQLVGTRNKQVADTAHLPLGVSSETLKSKNFTKQF